MSLNAGSQENQRYLPRINADKAEDGIRNSLSEVLVKAGHFEGGNLRLEERASSDLNDHQRMKRHFISCLNEIEAELKGVINLSQHITEGPAVDLVREQLEKLAVGKKQMLKNIADVELKIETCNHVADSSVENISTGDLLKIFWRGWKKATPAQQKRLLRRTFDVIYTSVDGMEAHYWIYPEREPNT